MHPALLRRLNAYIYKASIKHDFIYFLTTHSNVLIDQFSKQTDAQILHVIHSDGQTKCITAKTYIDNNGILDDLDIRASDLLQANGVIWVEGPSDRVYINKWIQIWSNDELKEGTHYQTIFYGGRLLAHLSAETKEQSSESVSILNTNRNAIILIDSDKKKDSDDLNDTKKRIQSEFDRIGALCWITNGKEIENYIPSEVTKQLLGLNIDKTVGKYQSFFEYLNKYKKPEGTKYSKKKSLLAENLIQYMTLKNMTEMLDLNEQMEKVCLTIRKWNGLENH